MARAPTTTRKGAYGPPNQERGQPGGVRKRGLLLINADAGGREVEPDQAGGEKAKVGGRFGLFIAEMITVLDEFARGRQHGTDLR